MSSLSSSLSPEVLSDLDRGRYSWTVDTTKVSYSVG